MRRDQAISYSIIGLILTAILILGFSGIDLSGLMIDLNQRFYDSMGELGVNIATFLISIFGNFSIILPVPYILALMSLIITLPINPLWLSLSVAFGASIGELSAWLLGRTTAKIMDREKYEKRIKGITTLVDKGYGFWMVFLFAATPLPDDVLLIALGMRKFPVRQVLLASFIGKLTQFSAVLLSVRALKNNAIGQFILYLFGINVTNGGVTSAGNPIISTITLVITISITLIIIMTDWRKVAKRWKRIKKTKD